MRHAPMFLLFGLAACGTEATAPPTDTGPDAAVTRVVTTETFQVPGQNPCTGELVTFTYDATLTTMSTGSLFRVANIARVTGVGALGTTYHGRDRTMVVQHQDRESVGFITVVHGSDGSGFLADTQFMYDRAGNLRILVNNFRCRGPGEAT